MAKKQLTLKGWVKIVGYKELAKTLGVHERSVLYWSRGHMLPHCQHMVQIVKLSKGKVSYKTMIETFVDHLNKE